jgi:glycerol kinase
MAADVILALDQGSSSTRCIAFGRDLRQRATAVRRVETRRPAPGMVEHDPDELLAGAREAIAEVVEGVGAAVGAAGIACQTESFVLWERETGRAVTPVVSWQDQRAAGLTASLAGRPEAAAVRARTGLTLDPTFSAPKVAWLLDADPELRRRAEADEVVFGDVAGWLARHLGGGEAHVTEPSNACRTLLVDLGTLRWDDELIDLFGVPATLLPEIRRSDDPGVHLSAAGLDAPLTAILGDQPAALYGQGCSTPGTAALTLGTGAFLWLNAGSGRPDPPPGVLATAAWERATGAAYALEAFCANAGNALDALAGMGLAGARSAPPPDWSRPRPLVVPAPAGLGTPHWHGVDRITILAADSATTAVDLAAAGLAGVAHQIADALEAIDAETKATVVRVGGGLSAHEGLLQAVADLSGSTLEVSEEPEATARGIAALAGEAAGLLDGVVAPPEIARRVSPGLDEVGRARERRRWREAVDVHMRADA